MTKPVWSRTGLMVGIAIFLLNLFDGLSTMFLLHTGRFFEANPIARWLIGLLGTWALAPKFALAAFLGVLLAGYWRTYRLARIGGLVVLIMYIAIAVNNTVVFFL